jgi:putative tricarboxylic transport membrane protein
VLGPLAENAFRQSMQIADGRAAIFFTRPIAAALIALGAIALVVPAITKRARVAKT